MKVSKITIGRLYNLGSYEHERVEVTVELGPKDSATLAMTNLERILAAMAPQKGKVDQAVIDHSERQVSEMLSERNRIGDEEFKRKHGSFQGTPLEYIARCAKSLEEEKERRAKYVERHNAARKMLDDLGGECKWKDAKLDWECDGDY